MVALRIVFFGTPAFAVPTLDALLRSPHRVAAAVTQPDRPRGRGQKTSDSPVKARALAAGIPARVLRSLTDEELRWKDENMRLYQQLAERNRASLREVEALTAPEPQRRRIDIPGSFPLSELKKRHA